jgi:hypothetical protein
MHGITSHFVVWRLDTATTVSLFCFLQQENKKMEKESNKQKKNSQKDVRSSSRRLR